MVSAQTISVLSKYGDTDLAGRFDPLALEQQVCFALAVTNRAVLAVYRPLLEPLGLTHPQYLVMLTLWDHQKTADADRSPLSVKQIASALQLDSATLSPMSQASGGNRPRHAHPKRRRRTLDPHRAH